MEENTFWVACWGILALSVTFIITVIAIEVNNSSVRYYESMDRCIDAKGTFIPQRDYAGVCIFK